MIARLRGECDADYTLWQRRDLSARRYVYVWAEGVYLQARMEPQAGMLVQIGATPDGKKELLGFQVGVRESAQSWRELLVDLKARGLAIAPELATGGGALGFRKALEAVSPTIRHQRCTVHKAANPLDKLPKSVQPAAESDLREICAAPCDVRDGDRRVRRQVCRQTRGGGDLPAQGSRRAADLLRLPRRTVRLTEAGIRQASCGSTTLHFAACLRSAECNAGRTTSTLATLYLVVADGFQNMPEFVATRACSAGSRSGTAISSGRKTWKRRLDPVSALALIRESAENRAVTA